MIITSPANERLKHARRVRDRREGDLIFIEGERLIEECLQAELPLHACFHVPELSPRARNILSELESNGCPVYPTDEDVLNTLSDTVNTQGIVVIAERRVFKLEDAFRYGEEACPIIVCLDEVQDPGNMGTIMRTAEAAGASGLLSTRGSVDAFAPKTLRSAMGSAFRLPVITDLEPEQIFAESAGLRLLATSSRGGLVYTDYDWLEPSIVVFGNEARGVRSEFLERTDALIRIPVCEPVESLNVASAVAAVLFEATRQRRAWLKDK